MEINYNQIKNLSQIFLYEYYRKGNTNPYFPIDIEGMVKYLDYKITIIDLDDNINAITDVISKHIYISAKINPYKNKAMFGRYNFTLAHEIGHIILHEEKYVEYLSQLKRSGQNCGLKNIIENQNIEREADIFAANLLLPIDLLKEEYRNNFGKQEIILNNGKLYPEYSESFIKFLKDKTLASEQAILIALKEAKIINIK